MLTTVEAMRDRAREDLAALDPAVRDAVCDMARDLRRLGVVPVHLRWRGETITVHWWAPLSGQPGTVRFAMDPAVLYWVQIDDVLAAMATIPDDPWPVRLPPRSSR